MKGFTKNVLPYIGTLIIILGILKAFIYYRAFNIIITDYLDLDEALLLFSSDIILFSIPFFLGIISNFLFTDKREIERVSTFQEKLKSTKSFPSRFRIYIKHYWYFTTLLIGHFIFFIVSFFINPPDHQEILIRLYFYLFLTTLTALIVTNEIKIVFDRNYNGVLTDENMFYIRIIVGIIILTVFIANSNIYFTKHKDDSKKYTIKLEEEKFINTNIDTCFLGRTNNFTFLYIKSTNESIILKNETIKSITIKRK